MCGRFVVSYSYQELLKLLEDDFDLFDYEEEYHPNYNITPSSKVISIIHTNNTFKAGRITWGTHINNYFLINVRSETITQKPLFKNAVIKTKCIIPASGFYEWDSNSKDPYYFFKNEPLYFAGIYLKQDNDFSTLILTKPATNDISDIHHRVPVIFDQEDAKKYLTNHTLDIIINLLKQSNKKKLQRYEVSKLINKPSNNTIENIKPYKKHTLL